MSEELPLRLPAHCATVAASDLHGRLVRAAETDDVSVDASDVENVGQAVLQLLVAARREAEANGRAFAIANPSPAFAERVRACGLGKAIGLPEEEGEMIP